MNTTTILLYEWFYSGSSRKSHGELDRLVKDVILQEDFNKKDLKNFSTTRMGPKIDEWAASAETSIFSSEDGWIQSSVKIRVPSEDVQHLSETHAPWFEIPGLVYRKPLDVLKTAFSEPAAEYFHLSGFEQYWKPSPDAEPERIFGELYSSDVFLKEEQKIRAELRPNGCTLEVVVAGMMLWSDSTHLTSFGTASLWPCYLFIGNQSKYSRAKPSCFAAHHLAYIPQVRTLTRCSLPTLIFNSYPMILRRFTWKPLARRQRIKL